MRQARSVRPLIVVLVTGVALVAGGCTVASARSGAPGSEASSPSPAAAEAPPPAEDVAPLPAEDVAPPPAESGPAAGAPAGGDTEDNRGRGGRTGGGVVTGGGGPTGGGAVAGGLLPADWPAEVPVPPGVIQGANRAAGVWVLTILANGDAKQVTASLLALYGSHGFTADSGSAIPLILTGPAYRVTVQMAPRDHTAAETNVVVQVSAVP
jgi:hypothetical protein